MPSERKRKYHSPVRDRAAQQTRTLVLDTARQLFLDQGYVATTMKQIAVSAGVSERTVYLAFPTKAELLNAVIGRAMAGDEADTLADRSEFQAAADDRSHTDVLHDLTSAVTALYERAGELLQVGEHAADSDAELRAFAESGAAATLGFMRGVIDELDARGALRAGLEPKYAADTMYAIGHFSVHQNLRKRRRWSRPRYQTWLTNTLAATILDDQRNP